MNVLISEDDDYKFIKIKKAVCKIIPDCNIHRESSLRGTLNYLKINDIYIDVLIQDMSLPVFDDDRRVSSNAGLDIVFTVEYDKIPIQFKFVCSSDGFIGEQFEKELDMCGFKFVHFDATRSLDGMFNILVSRGNL